MNTTALRWALCAQLLAPTLLAAGPHPTAPVAPVGPVGLAPVAPAQDGPFSAIPVEDALARAGKESRLVLLFFDNTESPEAKRMLAQTLAEPNVLAWIRDQAVAVKIPADDLTTLSKYGVSSFPTTMLLTPERKLLLQLQGYRDATQLLVAVNSVMLSLRDVQRPDGDQAENPMAWMAWGNYLFNNEPERAAEALESYLWALDRGDDFLPGFRAMHLEFLLERIAFLKPFTPDAVQALWDRRAQLRSSLLSTTGTEEDLHEYLRFSFWLRDEEDALGLFEDLGKLETEVGKHLYGQLVRSELKRLTAWRNYEQILALEPAPQAHLEARIAAFEKAAEETGSPDTEVRTKIVDDAADYFECLLATGKGADGMALATAISDKFPTGRTFRGFIERSNRLGLFALSERLGEAGLEKVEGKGRRLIELELLRGKEMQKDKSFSDFFEKAKKGDDDDGGDGDGDE